MFGKAAATITAALAASALAQSQSATVVVETNAGGPGVDVQNSTLTIPLNKAYKNAALEQVSSLYLIGAAGVPLKSITCTPFKNSDGTSIDGHSFNSTVPSFLSTNTVVVGSIVCTTNSILQAPSVPGGPRSTQTSSSSSMSLPPSSASTTPSTSITDSSTPVPATTTLSSSTSPGGGDGKPPASTTTSAAPSQSSQSTNGGNSLFASSEFFSGLAIAGLGIAFVL